MTYMTQNHYNFLQGMDVGFDQAQVPLGDTTNNYDAQMNFLGKWLTNDGKFFFFFFFAFTKLSKDNLGFLKYV